MKIYDIQTIIDDEISKSYNSYPKEHYRTFSLYWFIGINYNDNKVVIFSAYDNNNYDHHFLEENYFRDFDYAVSIYQKIIKRINKIKQER